MKLKFVLALICCLSAAAVQGQVACTITIAAGTTVTWSTPLTMPCDVVIEPTATLIIETVVKMGEGKSIHIKNDGLLICKNGELTTNGPGRWKGIKIDGTAVGDLDYPVALRSQNFIISRAEAALDIDGRDKTGAFGKYRNLEVDYTVFEYNYIMMRGYNSNGNIDAVMLTTFTNCKFRESASFNWPFYVNSPRNWVFKWCVFDYEYTGAGIGLHFDHAHDVYFSKCEFYYGSLLTIALHFDSENVLIEECLFIEDVLTPLSGVPIQKYSIAMGEPGSFDSGITKGVTIRKNLFLSVDPDITSSAIYNGSEETEDLVIEDNIFENYTFTVHSSNNVKGHSYIRRNTFINYHYAISNPVYPGLHNKKLYISCNKFLNGSSASGGPSKCITGEGYMDHIAAGEDPGNIFQGGDIHIENNSVDGFVYGVHTSNPFPPVTTVNTYLTSALNPASCSLPSGGGGDTGDDGGGTGGNKQDVSFSVVDAEVLRVSPNPATDFVNLKTDCDGPLSIRIVNSLGQIAKELNLDVTPGESQVTVDLNGLASGVYLLSVRQAGTVFTEKLIVR